MTSFMPIVSSVPIVVSEFENIYNEASNTRKSRTPVINSQVVKEDLTSKSLTSGGISTINLPQGPLLSHSMVVLKIAKEDLAALPKGVVNLKKGWGYSCIKNYQIKPGGNTQLRIYGPQLLVKAMADCETASKRESVLQLGGEAYDGDPATLKHDLVAYVHVYLPWSNISASRYLPYDSGILTKPIQLQFELAPAREIFSYSAADRAVVEPLLPKAWKDSYYMMQTALMALGPGQSIRPAVGPNGDAQYNYGWIYPSSFVSAPFQGRSVSDGKGKINVRLEEFPNGNIQSIDLYLRRVTAGIAGTDVPLSDCQTNNTIYEDISNAEVKYGSQVVYRSDDLSNKLMALSEYTSNNQFDTSFPNISNLSYTGLEVAPNIKTSSWLRVQFAQFNENHFRSLVQDSVTIVNNMLSIDLNTPELEDLSNGDIENLPLPIGDASGRPTAQPTYEIVASYNMLGSLNTWKGYTDFMWLPADAQGPYTMAS